MNISRYLADDIFQWDTVIIAMSTTTTTVRNEGGGYEDFVVIDESRWALGCWVPGGGIGTEGLIYVTSPLSSSASTVGPARARGW